MKSWALSIYLSFSLFMLFIKPKKESFHMSLENPLQLPSPDQFNFTNTVSLVAPRP